MSVVDPDKERQRLTAIYSNLTDEELLRVAEGHAELTEVARNVLDGELSRRKIDLPSVTPESTEELEFRHMVTVRQFRDLPEALLAKGSLNSAGIECVLLDDNLIRMDWFISNFIGGVKLQVNAEDSAAAAEILSLPIPENFDFEGTEDYQQPRCPNCQSLDTTFQELYKGVAYTSAWLISVPIPVQRKGWKCHDCGNEWEGNAPAETD